MLLLARRARLPIALAGLLAAACQTYPATQTLVFLHAEPTTAAEADELRVTVYSAGVEVAPARVEPVDRTLSQLARIPLAPRDSDATRTFEVLAELLADGQPVLTVRIAGGYVDREVREIHAWLHPECEGLDDCGAGRTCARGLCVASCFDGALAEDAPTESRPRCGECARCEQDRCAPLDDGAVCGCGEGQNECRDGLCVATPEVASFDLSRGHACAIRGGSLYCWGQRHAGRLLEDSDVPLEVPGIMRAAHVAAADASTCVTWVTGGPTFHRTCWGYNVDGRLAVDVPDDAIIPPTEAPASDPDFQTVEGGLEFYCGLDRAGRIWCWAGTGRYAVGEPGDLPWTTPMQIHPEDQWAVLDVDWQNGCAVHQDGRLLCWGQNANQQLARADPDSVEPDLVRDADGQLLAGFTDVGVWEARTCGVREGELWCWGASLTDEGRILPPTRMGERADWVEVDVGQRYACGLRSEGELYCIGDNSDARLGLGDETDRDAFERVALTEDQRFREVTLDQGTSCAIDEGGSLWCWGDDICGNPSGDDLPGLLGLGPLPTTYVTRPRRVCF